MSKRPQIHAFPQSMDLAVPPRRHFDCLRMTKIDQSIFELCERKENAPKINSKWSYFKKAP